MDAESRSLVKFLSIIASNFWLFPTKAGGGGLPFIFNLQDRIDATGWESVNYFNQEWGGIIFNANSIMNDTWNSSVNPVRITCRLVLLTYAPPNASSATTSFVVGVNSICGANTIGTILSSILGFIFWTKTGMVRLLNNVCSKFLLLVWVTVSFLLLVWVTVLGFHVRLPCASFAVSVFDS